MPDFPKIGGASASEVWAYGTRKLTALDGQPRTDIIGSDTSIESSAGARLTRIDKVPVAETPTEVSVVMDGTEKTLLEITTVKVSEVEAWLDLTTMDTADVIVVRYYRKVKAAGAYVKYAEETYADAQTIPLVCVLNKKVYRDTKISAQQSAGVNRTLDFQAIRVAEKLT